MGPPGLTPPPLARCRSLDALQEVLGEDNAALNELKTLFTLAEAYGYADWLVFDASVVRGLAYYTGTVFEAFDREGVLRAICGGGRYDKLMSTFGALSPTSSRPPPPQQRPAPTPKPWWHKIASVLMLATRCGAVPCIQRDQANRPRGRALFGRAGGEDQPMVGFGFGDAVIVELLKERGLMPELSASVQDVVIALGGPNMQVAATSVATQLRAQVQKR